MSWRESFEGTPRRSAQGDAEDVVRCDGDVVIRRRVSLWETEPPKNARLMDVYRYWESLRPDGMLPKRSAFDVDRLRPVMGMTSIVDVDTADPFEFRIRLFGSNLPLDKNMSNLALRDVDRGAYREVLSKDYQNAKMLGVPAYHEVVALLDYRRHSYARLILPFSLDGRTVNQLMVCSAHQNFPDLLQLVD
jgi:hypothetical protein